MRLARMWSPIGALAIAAALLSGQPAAAAENSASNIETPVTPHFGDVTPFALHYQIANVNSGKCLTVSFGSHDNNANVNQYACLGAGNRAQLWEWGEFDVLS